MQIPRDETLAEAIYRDIEKDEYLNEIYNALLHNYSLKLFDIDSPMVEINISHALRFADLLAKSTYIPNVQTHRLWGQEIAILLNLVYPENLAVKYYLGSILSSLGNYRGLQSTTLKGFMSTDLFDGIYYEYDMANHIIPGKEKEYFFHEQKDVYDSLDSAYFSYSGPTSMGKSFVVQTYIEEQIKKGSTQNYAVLVPTKALINEVRSNIISELKDELKNKNYRVVTASGDLVLQQEHHFVFVMTPERMLHMLIGLPQINIDFLFIDEAHKISDRGGRSTYYYKVISQLFKSGQNPKIIFASPNIPNPEIYLDLIPNAKNIKMQKLASKYSPVCQFKYYIDLCDKKLLAYNDFTKTALPVDYQFNDGNLTEVVERVGANLQNLIYCSSKGKVLELSVAYARKLKPINNEKLIALSNDVKKEVHDHCYLADLILKGVAYHVGYLPANIRLRIERCFEDGDLRTIFCTSTLIEGVNLPADNLFITSYKNGPENMNEVEFRNLIGRVGRIKYNLYGNVFLIRENDRILEKRYMHLLEHEVPKQVVSIYAKNNRKYMEDIISDLKKGDMELSQCHDKAAEKDYEALRKFAMILIRDIALEQDTPLKKTFIEEGLLNSDTEIIIREKFPLNKTSDDITLSYDQAENLRDAIANGLSYPELKGENDEVDFEELVAFMMSLSKIFKWEIYEKRTIGKKGTKSADSVMRWYSQILLRWIRGKGLNWIIRCSLEYKSNNPETGVWINNVKLFDYYDEYSKLHQNYIIAETLDVIEHVLLFSISNYFRKFSLEYKDYHKVEYFKNDWYEYVEYGTTNPVTIFLQQNGFSREVSSYIQKSNFLIKVDEKLKIKRSILACGDLGVETEVNDIQFNVPELFID